ncbi:hypothetical protein BX666DRAFT_188492 [Dichotomocladium elegans]|nr:hypothetical protein BX666DRAFT_184260 [Dichotomocladium elegans]KAI9316715.1 hypothetical protein BX666DRAFT_188492 [Dichotomocladium elegans]
MIQTPGNNLRSPHKPKLEEADVGALNHYFDICISSSRKGHASEETERIYQENMRAGQRNESLKSLDKAFEFCAAACNQEQAGFPKWLWNYEIESNDEKFIEMMKYTLTDFHLNCLVKTNTLNDERTPFVESVIPPLKAYAKVLDMLTFIW